MSTWLPPQRCTSLERRYSVPSKPIIVLREDPNAPKRNLIDIYSNFLKEEFRGDGEIYVLIEKMVDDSINAAGDGDSETVPLEEKEDIVASMLEHVITDTYSDLSDYRKTELKNIYQREIEQYVPSQGYDVNGDLIDLPTVMSYEKKWKEAFYNSCSVFCKHAGFYIKRDPNGPTIPYDSAKELYRYEEGGGSQLGVLFDDYFIDSRYELLSLEEKASWESKLQDCNEKYEKDMLQYTPPMGYDKMGDYIDLSCFILCQKFEQAEAFLIDANIPQPMKISLLHRRSYSPFHDDLLIPLQLIDFKAPHSLTRLMIDIGGKETLMQRNENGQTVLHTYISQDSSQETIQLMIEVGGHELISTKDNSLMLPIHCCVGYGGDDNDLYSVEVEPTMRTKIQIFRYILQEGIRLNVGGEFGIGGLFVRYGKYGRLGHKMLTTLERLDLMFEWETIASYIEDIVRGTPILQAAIKSNSSVQTLRFIINHFSWSISREDSRGLLPIEFAIQHGLDWDNGVKDIFWAVVASLIPEYTPIHIGALVGLNWEIGMEILLDGNESELDKIEPSTQLYPFAYVASINSDLTSVYEMLRRRPDVMMSWFTGV